MTFKLQNKNGDNFDIDSNFNSTIEYDNSLLDSISVISISFNNIKLPATKRNNKLLKDYGNINAIELISPIIVFIIVDNGKTFQSDLYIRGIDYRDDKPFSYNCYAISKNQSILSFIDSEKTLKDLEIDEDYSSLQSNEIASRFPILEDFKMVDATIGDLNKYNQNITNNSSLTISNITSIGLSNNLHVNITGAFQDRVFNNEKRTYPIIPISYDDVQGRYIYSEVKKKWWMENIPHNHRAGTMVVNSANINYQLDFNEYDLSNVNRNNGSILTFESKPRTNNVFQLIRDKDLIRGDVFRNERSYLGIIDDGEFVSIFSNRSRISDVISENKAFNANDYLISNNDDTLDLISNTNSPEVVGLNRVNDATFAYRVTETIEQIFRDNINKDIEFEWNDVIRDYWLQYLVYYKFDQNINVDLFDSQIYANLNNGNLNPTVDLDEAKISMDLEHFSVARGLPLVMIGTPDDGFSAIGYVSMRQTSTLNLNYNIRRTFMEFIRPDPDFYYGIYNTFPKPHAINLNLGKVIELREWTESNPRGTFQIQVNVLYCLKPKQVDLDTNTSDLLERSDIVQNVGNYTIRVDNSPNANDNTGLFDTSSRTFTSFDDIIIPCNFVTPGEDKYVFLQLSVNNLTSVEDNERPNNFVGYDIADVKSVNFRLVDNFKIRPQESNIIPIYEVPLYHQSFNLFGNTRWNNDDVSSSNLNFNNLRREFFESDKKQRDLVIDFIKLYNLNIDYSPKDNKININKRTTLNKPVKIKHNKDYKIKIKEKISNISFNISDEFENELLIGNGTVRELDNDGTLSETVTIKTNLLPMFFKNGKLYDFYPDKFEGFRMYQSSIFRDALFEMNNISAIDYGQVNAVTNNISNYAISERINSLEDVDKNITTTRNYYRANVNQILDVELDSNGRFQGELKDSTLNSMPILTFQELDNDFTEEQGIQTLFDATYSKWINFINNNNKEIDMIIISDYDTFSLISERKTILIKEDIYYVTNLKFNFFNNKMQIKAIKINEI